MVEFDAAAVRDFEDVKGRQERKAVFNAVDKLKEKGPRLSGPHVKSLKGEVDLWELRPKQGRSAVRAIYTRDGGHFVVLAVASTKDRLGRAIGQARSRLQSRR